MGMMRVVMVNRESLADSWPARMPQDSIPRIVLLQQRGAGGGNAQAMGGKVLQHGAATRWGWLTLVHATWIGHCQMI